MREIKFRAWERLEKKMYYDVEETYDHEGLSFVPESCFGDLLDSEEWIVMQYTGLKDRNGKEIYEGDIFKVKAEFEHWNKDNDYTDDKISIFNYIVKFGEYEQDGSSGEYGTATCLGFYAEGLEKDYLHEYEYTTSLLVFKDIEVIGNIYENPELLEENK